MAGNVGAGTVAATLKASVNENRGGEQADHSTLASVSEEVQEMRYLGKALPCTKMKSFTSK